MMRTWNEVPSSLYLLLLLLLLHHFEPQAVNVLLVVCLSIAVWQILRWKFMSRKRRAEVIAEFKKKKGIPPNQPHKVDSLLKSKPVGQ